MVLYLFQLHLHGHYHLYHHPFVLATVALCIEACNKRKLQIITNAKRPYFNRQALFFSSYRYCTEHVSYVNAVNDATGSGNRYLWDKMMTLYNVHHLSRKSLITVEYLFIRVLTVLTLLRRNYFSNFSTFCISNVNNTGTKYVRIMKQTAFWRGKKPENIYHV